MSTHFIRATARRPRFRPRRRRWLRHTLQATFVAGALGLGALSLTGATIANASPVRAGATGATEHATAAWRVALLPHDDRCHPVDPFPHIISIQTLAHPVTAGYRVVGPGLLRPCTVPGLQVPEPLGGAPRLGAQVRKATPRLASLH